MRLDCVGEFLVVVRMMSSCVFCGSVNDKCGVFV